MSDDGTQSEELHDLRQQLADALRRIAEQQQVIDGLGRRLERSLSTESGGPGPAVGAAAASVTDERDRPSATAIKSVAAGTTGEQTTLSLSHGNVFTPRESQSSCSQTAQPTAESVPSTRFVVQQAHELAEFSLDGRLSLVEYLDRFEEHCAHVYAGSLDEALPLLKSKLSGRIRDVFIACGDIFSSYQTVKRRMTEWMELQAVSNCSARNRFRCCKRNQGESLALYALRLASAFNDAYPHQDVQTSQELREHLLDNLPHRAADYLRRQMHYTREVHGINMTWRNLSALLDRERLDDDGVSDADPSLFYASEQENQDRQSRSSRRRSSAFPAGRGREPHGGSQTWRRRESIAGGQRVERRRRRAASTSSSSTTSERRSMETLRCYFCGHPGHLERECRRKQDLCFTCGRSGHYMRDCSLSHSRQTSQSRSRNRHVSPGGSQRAVFSQRQRYQSPPPGRSTSRAQSRHRPRQQGDSNQNLSAGLSSEPMTRASISPEN